MDGKHDEAFQKIFREEKNIACFFDAFFGFMYRCTDFYTVTDGRPPGYPPGISREILFSLYEKWKREKEIEKEKKDEKKPESPANTSPTMNDDIGFSNVEPNSRANMFVDCQNGAAHDMHHWSQTTTHLDVVVLLPPHVLKTKDLQVRLITREMQIKVNDKEILSGTFPHAIKSDDSLWFLDPGKKLDIHIEKARSGWWDRLLEHESPIDMAKLDSKNNHHDEMTEDEQMMRIQELLWNQRLRDLAQKATDEISDEMEKPDTCAD